MSKENNVRTKKIFINTNSGKISASASFLDKEKCAVIFPSYYKNHGGTQNSIVRTIEKSFLANGFSTLCIESEEDINNENFSNITSNIIAWVDNNFPLLSDFWISGIYSGAWLASNLVMRRPEISGFITVGLPTKLFDFSFLTPCSVPGILIQGENDQNADVQYILNLASNLKRRMNDSFIYEIINDSQYELDEIHNLKILYDLITSGIKNIMNIQKNSNNNQLGHKKSSEKIREVEQV